MKAVHKSLTHCFVPISGSENWKAFLTQPDLHWRPRRIGSFSPERAWHDDYARFVEALCGTALTRKLSAVTAGDNARLYLGWAEGDPRFLE